MQTNRRVLYVEDDRVNVLLFEEVCRMAGGLEVASAGSGAEAALVLQHFRPDLLVLDRDPTRDIRNTRAIRAVYVGGRKVPTIWQTCVGRAAQACGAGRP